MRRATTKIDTVGIGKLRDRAGQERRVLRLPALRAVGGPDPSSPFLRAIVILSVVLCLLAMFPGRARAVEGKYAAAALAAFQSARRDYQSQPGNPTNAWQFARTCFDLGDDATNNTERAAIADQGIEAARHAIAEQPGSGPAHYYLGLNLGQLARTKTLGALRLVSQMEREFLEAIRCDAGFDYAGAERSLGLLYRDAPSIASIGSRSKSRQHLERAVQLAPDYPENRLNLVESCIKWNDRNAARHELVELEANLAEARKKFSGPQWAASWEDWDNRLVEVRKSLGEPPKPLPSPRH